jgi:hypothetical protein
MKLVSRNWFLVSLLAVVTTSMAQDKAGPSPTENSYLKLCVSSLAYQAVRMPANARQLWITIQYESAIRPNSKTTYALVGEYISGLSNSTILTFRPQFRYYSGPTRFNGFFAGAYPSYAYRNHSAYDGQLIGAGMVTGYQHLIHNRIPIEFNVFLGWETGHVRYYSAGIALEGNQSYRTGLMELNIGLPVRKRK